MLDDLNLPQDLTGLSEAQLEQLAAEIRERIVSTVTTTGGHLGSNLGMVELTIALHRVFNSPEDPILFDTGHQAYVHKMLTGRAGDFATLRKEGGLSGYPNRAESPHDWIENSHASTVLSYAHGLAKAFELRGELLGYGGDRTVVAVIGDGALTGGLAYEAINNLGHSGTRAVVVLNDNGRSYAPTISKLSQSLTALRLNPTYVATRERLRRAVREVPGVGELAYQSIHGITSAFREVVTPHTFFENLGVRYVGPIDGHDIAVLEDALRHAQEWDGPIVVHVLTEKGRGYAPAEADEVQRLHDFKVALATPDEEIAGTEATLTRSSSYTDAFSKALVSAAEVDSSVVALTAAMPGPTGLLPFEERFADRFMDVGIAEGHEVTVAAGLAFGGMRPVVCVYSTFFSRAFDQANLDVGLHQLPVTFVLDRAGVTGDDGPSHHGIFDLVLTLAIPGMTVFAPSTPEDVAEALRHALRSSGPASIRFPKTPPVAQAPDAPLEPLSARRLASGSGEVALVGVGKMRHRVEDALAILQAEGVSATAFDPRVLRPLDQGMVAELATAKLVVTVEDGIAVGGAGTHLAAAIAEQASAQGLGGPAVLSLGVPHRFIPQAAPDAILARLGLDGPGIAASVLAALANVER